MATDTEKKNHRIGLGVSIGLHALMIVLFFLVLAWREPDPPIPEYGIELNFGMENVGAGDIQPEQPSSSSPETFQEEIIEPPVEEINEDIQQEEVPDEIIPVEEVTEEVIDSEAIDSPDLIEPEEIPEKEAEVVPEEEPVPEKVIVTPVVKPENPAKEVVGEENNEAENAETANQGDNVEVSGDKGDEKGSLDSRALYGSHGGGGGPLLELTGWLWDSEPSPQDTSNENGKIVFEIKIDERGEIISVKTIEKTVSPPVERIYREEVQSLTFSPLSSNTVPAPVSTGRITFIIRSK